jgi:lipopolysaccharide transport system permease protein
VRRGGISASRLRGVGARLAEASAEPFRRTPPEPFNGRSGDLAGASAGFPVQKWVENRRSPRWLPRLDVRELWAYREVAYALALRDVKLRYRQTLFGAAWALLQPLAAAAIFAVVFGRLVGVPSDGLPYPAFVYAGLVIWTYVSGAVDAASRSLVDRAELVTNVYFPRLHVPLAAVLPGVLDLGISLLLLGIVTAVYGVVPGVGLVLLPVWIGAAVLIAFAAGLWLSALTVEFRDVRHALGFIVQVWLFASPVVYPSSLLEGWTAYLFAVNPLAGVLDGFRWSALGGPAPGADALVSLGAGAVLLLGGLMYFHRAERRFADVI